VEEFVMRTSVIAVVLGLLTASGTAEARPRYHHVRVAPRVGVHIVLNPWAPTYVPDVRDGWVWVEGYYDAHGEWIPGYWRPVGERAGWAWVPGYWQGESYMEGYWREVNRPGYAWVDGYYDHGQYVPGSWEPAGPPPPPNAPPPPPGDVHHDYE
jgi:hypothetical protein